MSSARVIKLRHNLDKVVRQAIELLSDTLRYSPPKRTRRNRHNRFRFSVDVRIEEVNQEGTVVGSYEHHLRDTKTFAD